MAKWIDGRRLRRAALLPLACLLAAAAAVALAAGCGGTDKSSSSASVRKVVQVQHLPRDRWTYARERFRETCAGCHTLADAGATGRRFNLDRDGDITEDRARWAIAEGEPGMPAWRGVLSKREYEELVAYVSTVERHQQGETYWHWQMELRMEGELWSPEDTPGQGISRARAPASKDASGAPGG